MHYETDKWIRFRLFVLGLCFSFGFLIITLRAYQLQILDSESLTQLAKKQHLMTIRLQPKRGIIYDRTGKELAVNKETFSVYVRPPEISDPRATIYKLSKALNIPAEEVRKKIEQDANFVWVKRHISKEQLRRLELLVGDKEEKQKNRSTKLERDLGEGIGSIAETQRYYPFGELAGSVLGFTGTDNLGLEGLEHYYDSWLKGEPIFLVAQRDARRKTVFIFNQGPIFKNRGGDLMLTIDVTIQYIVEKELNKAVAGNNAKRGWAIVMDPFSGEVLAMASIPGFDLNRFNEYPSSFWKNHAVISSYEPGSTFKPFVISSALEEGIIKPTDTFYCENGSYKIHGKEINDIKPYKTLTVSEIIAYSSNIGAAKIAERLGKERLYKHLRDFGFGEKTGIDFPGESGGIFPPPKKWSKLTVSTIGFGQGVSVTAIQMVRALSAIANGGYLVKPFLVLRKVNPETRQQVIKEIERGKKIISDKTIKEITSMLEEVVSPKGTGARAMLNGYRVAGKTGTAQKVKENVPGYLEGKYICSFMGFVPVEAPRLVIMVVIDEPEASYLTGGRIAAPVFREIARQSLAYLQVSSYESISSEDIVFSPKEGPRESGITGEEEQKEDAGAITIASGQMPNLIGQSLRDAVKMAYKIGLELNVQGSGFVVEQYPPAGSSISNLREGWVKLGTKGLTE